MLCVAVSLLCGLLLFCPHTYDNDNGEDDVGCARIRVNRILDCCFFPSRSLSLELHEKNYLTATEKKVKTAEKTGEDHRNRNDIV